MKAIHYKRLLNVAKALRESKEPKAFTMSFYTYEPGDNYPCGTPACALGHYAARRDLQKAFRIGRFGLVGRNTSKTAEKHFGLGHDEINELFDGEGCGNAKTVLQAARYIERFVARKRKESK